MLLNTAKAVSTVATRKYEKQPLGCAGWGYSCGTMAQITFPPPYTTAESSAQSLRESGFAVLAPQDFAAWIGTSLPELRALDGDWTDLPPDAYLKDGGRYRRRRHSCFVDQGEELAQVPHRPHWQPVQYNALHGGMQRMFDPMEPATAQSEVWCKLLLRLARLSDEVFCPPGMNERWYIEAHQFHTQFLGQYPAHLCLAHTCGAHHDDVFGRYFIAQFGRKVLTPPAVAHRHRHHALGLFLSHNKFIKFGNYAAWCQSAHQLLLL